MSRTRRSPCQRAIAASIALTRPDRTYPNAGEEAELAGQPASSVQTVKGWPALVIGAANGQNGARDLDANGLHVAVIGPYSGDGLREIAETLS